MTADVGLEHNISQDKFFWGMTPCSLVWVHINVLLGVKAASALG